MSFSLSTNIKNSLNNDFHYIVTANARRVLGGLIADYQSGIHCFTMIGTYGTGKSSFITALERDLQIGKGPLFNNKGQFNQYQKFHFLNIVGDYTSLPKLLADELNIENTHETKKIFKQLDFLIQKCKKEKQFLLIVADEFGKVLEYATNHQPERELYFLQQFAEYINRQSIDNVLFITTLHQNFSAYAKKLTEQQRNEWTKVKGRFKEIVFSEPIEQLIYLAAEFISEKGIESHVRGSFKSLLQLAKQTKFISNDFDENIARKLFPLDIFSAVALTQAIQRYGQNERSLFSFLISQGENSLHDFQASPTKSYNLANVYDYITYNFYFVLSEVNADTSNWAAMRVALERVEGVFETDQVNDACKIVKAIGLCNLFGSSSVMFTEEDWCKYSRQAMDISNPKEILKRLETHKIIRYAKYKSQYILFEGTDVNIEDELYKAVGQIPKPIHIVEDIKAHFENRQIAANAFYYKTGTPRFFEFELSDEAQTTPFPDHIDGSINLVFPISQDQKSRLIELSKECRDAVNFVWYKNTDEMVQHVYQIQKLDYILTHIISDEADKVAIREVKNLIDYEKGLLNRAINQSLTSFSDNIEWYYKGEQMRITSLSDFNKLLSKVCDDVYSSTPIIQNELFNRQRINSSISTARVNLLTALIDEQRVIQRDLGFAENNYPPEKTIYYTLLKHTGIHHEVNGIYTLGAPKSESMQALWNECEAFLKSSIEKQRKIGDLIKILKTAPFKLRQGFLEFWIPIYLIIKKQDYSLYNSDGVFIPDINREVLDLLQKSPDKFKIKAFAVEGIKLEFFNQYRNFINLEQQSLITGKNFIETIKPFLTFYRKLNDYAKNTNKFDLPHTAKFRNVLAKAKDPEKTFFEDLPRAFGFRDESLLKNETFMSQYQDLIKGAIRELRTCYSHLIDRIEENILETLGLSGTTFETYKAAIDRRFKSIKPTLLSGKQRIFLERVLFPITDKTAWFESICFVVLDKPLTSLRDDEETLMIKNIQYLFNALTKFIDISKVAKRTKDEIYNIELISTQGSFKPQSFILSESQQERTKDMEQKITELLSGDENLDICTLLRIINKKIGK